jgi:hypothetical protein
VTVRYVIGADGTLRARGRAPVTTAPVVVPPDPTGPTYPALPDLPTYNFVDLYQPGDSFMDTVRRMPSRRHLVLPDGFDGQLEGFGEGGGTISAFHQNLRGIIGPGKDKARLTLRPLSSTATQRAQITPQSSGGTTQLTLLRLGSMQGTAAERQSLCVGFTLNGTDQQVMAESESQPHRYQGINMYGGINSIVQDMRVTGVPGHWNAPPGETFQIQGYKDRGTILRDVEVDGFNIAGRRVGSSPFGGNNTIDSLLEDVYGHDGYISGFTWSFSGSFTAASSASSNVTTRRLRAKYNANHQLAGGKRFTGINHENVLGFVRHYDSEFWIKNMTEWNVGHMAFNNYLSDNADIQIIEPVWHESPPRNAGCFTVTIQKTYAFNADKSPGVQRQVTPPRVVKNGIELRPYHVTEPPKANLPLDPTRDYVVCHP